MHALHPLVSLSIEIVTTDDAVAALPAGKADLIAAFNMPPRRELLVHWRTVPPFGCVVAPAHPLAAAANVSLQEADAYPVALQSKALTIRRYLEAQCGWLFSEQRGRVETTSLHPVKQLAKGGQYLAFTSELDAAPDLIDVRCVSCRCVTAASNRRPSASRSTPPSRCVRRSSWWPTSWPSRPPRPSQPCVPPR